MKFSERIYPIKYYEQTQESLAMLKLLAQSQRDVEARRYKPIKKAFTNLAARIKDLPCVLVMQRDRDGKPVHAIWGIPKGEDSPAVLVTAYRPDPDLWSDDLLRRRS